MSLILEALKKSEQQRRLGEAPTLGSPVQVARKRRSLLPVFAVAILAALAAGWWLSRTPATDEPGAPRPDSVAKAPAPATPATHPTKPAAPAPQRVAPPGATRPPPTTNATTATNAPPPANRNPAPTAPAATTPATTKAPVATAPAAQTSPAAAPVARTPAPSAPAPAAAPGSAPAKPPINPVATAAPPAAHDAATAKTVDTKPANPNATAAPAAQPAKPAPAQPALPSVWDLPYATRKDLPELALTMHVFASEPSERFVVIKGERHAEGDELGDGLVLKEIRADGMVLEFKGQRFVYPRDGR